jgi:hypothetical protein
MSSLILVFPIKLIFSIMLLSVSIQPLGKGKQILVILARQGRHLVGVYHSLS